MLEAVEVAEEVLDGIGVAGVEGEQGGAGGVLAAVAEALVDEGAEFFDVEVEDAGDEAEGVDVLALVLGGAAGGLDGGAGDRDADLEEAGVVRIRLHVVAVVDQHAALAE